MFGRGQQAGHAPGTFQRNSLATKPLVTVHPKFCSQVRLTRSRVQCAPTPDNPTLHAFCSSKVEAGPAPDWHACHLQPYQSYAQYRFYTVHNDPLPRHVIQVTARRLSDLALKIAVN